ncbi:MAG: hypothetical protein IJL87_08870 [Clostridia bacterium]|nr:hypothetical protein [Clostridia bacterium]
MNQLLFEIYVPALMQKFDVKVPKDIYLYQAIALISEALEKYTNGVYRSNDDAVLCSKESGLILNVNSTPTELGLINGSQLILI